MRKKRDWIRGVIENIVGLTKRGDFSMGEIIAVIESGLQDNGEVETIESIMLTACYIVMAAGLASEQRGGRNAFEMWEEIVEKNSRNLGMWN